MKKISLYISRVLLSLFFTVLFNPNASADTNEENTASLKAYFNKCVSQLHSPVVLKMADTLYTQARRAQNKRFQVLARYTVLDYYYFQGNKEKIIQLVPDIKRLCREFNELDMYYFVWGSRLITFYLKNGQPHHALAEAQNMLREAQGENYLPGIAECYKAMANIYLIQSNSQQSTYNFKKLIDIVEKNKLDDVNLPVYYYSLINGLLELEQVDEAEKTLNKASLMLKKNDVISAYQQLCLAQSSLAVYLKKGNKACSRKALEKIEHLFATSKELAVHSTYLHDSRMKYYMSIKDYPKALAMLDSIKSHNSSSESNLVVLNKKGEIYWKMNDKAAAAEYYRDYVFANDSVRKRSMQNSADEIAGLLDLRQLEQEKQQLMIDIKDRRLITTYWAIGTLILIVIIATYVIVHIYRLNRQLKESKLMVERQNETLLETSEELRKAKNRAEEASCMKTDFIQNITHEVRTPLNSIVGFSQILVECFEESEAEEFASLITINSNHLLRLFDDVLELSNADQVEALPYDVVDTIQSSCRAAIKNMEPFAKEEVELIFQPSENDLRIHTNPALVTLILNYLLHNATKFTTAGSIVLDYTVVPSEGIIRYSVTDTGIGIPADQCEAVFDRFKKLDTFTQGSGLGLAVSRTIATKLSGSLYVDTQYTAGARFVLTLPFIPE